MSTTTQVLSNFLNEQKSLAELSQSVLSDYEFTKNRLSELREQSIPVFGNPFGKLMNRFINVYYRVNLHLLNYDQYQSLIQDSSEFDLDGVNLHLQLKSMSMITQEIKSEYIDNKHNLAFVVETNLYGVSA